MKEFIKRIIVNMLIVSLMIVVCQNVYGEELDLQAKSAVLIDADNNRILYTKNADEISAMASTTKIMTCIIALEQGNLNDVVTFSKKASIAPKVRMGVREGEQYVLEDLLYCMMLESYNDIAVAVAEHIGKSVEQFAQLMNNKAYEIGAKNTNFVTPNGLDAQGHYSTAYDMAIIAAYAVKNDKFIDIINTKSYSFMDVENKISRSATNKDAFLGMMDGAYGVKTGYTSQAGYCFVGALKKGEHNLISVVLGCGWPPNKQYKWSDTKKLMEYGLENYQYKNLIKGVNQIKKIKVLNGKKESTETYIDQDMSLLLREDEDVKYNVVMKKIIEAPIKVGEKVGDFEVIINGKKEKSFDVKAKNSIERKDIQYYFNELLSVFFL